MGRVLVQFDALAHTAVAFKSLETLFSKMLSRRLSREYLLWWKCIVSCCFIGLLLADIAIMRAHAYSIYV